MAASTSTSLRPFAFLSLPDAARKQIYNHIFNDQHPAHSPFRLEVLDDGPIPQPSRTKATTSVDIAILQTCATIHSEALQELYSQGVSYANGYSCDNSLTIARNAAFLRANISDLDIAEMSELCFRQILGTLLSLPKLRRFSFGLKGAYSTTVMMIDEGAEVDLVRLMPPLPDHCVLGATRRALKVLLPAESVRCVETVRAHIAGVVDIELSEDEDDLE